MKTLNDLRYWINGYGVEDLPVEIMIETDDCQYQFPLTDIALVVDRNGVGHKIVLMHEKWKGKTGSKPEGDK